MFDLITITAPGQIPNKILDTYLHENANSKKFIPCLSLVSAENKKQEKIIWLQKKLESKSANDFDYQKQLNNLKNMSVKDYVTSVYGFTDFDSKLNHFGYIGDPKSKISSYMTGEAIFIKLNGFKSTEAKKKEIDWKKMNQEAYEKAKKEAEGWSKVDDNDLINVRQKVYMRPHILIDKNGQWFDEESMDNIDVHKSIETYQSTWEKCLNEAGPEDLFSHWETIE